MPRLARVDVADYAYHVINRASGRSRIFETEADYALFEELLNKTKEETDMRILAYCIMPNHWHLVVYPRNDGDLGLFMHRLTNAHTRLVHVRTGTIGYGPLYQGRYKSFLIQKDSHLLAVIKYVERNARRAKLVRACDAWRWGSAWLRLHGTNQQQKLLSASPTPFPDDYHSWINTSDKDDDLAELRRSANKGVPYGGERWVDSMITTHHLESTLRSAGRPRKS
jgi:putative transposase